MNILFLGDIIGRAGRKLLKNQLELLKVEHNIDLVICNGENAANGFGITDKVYNELLDKDSIIIVDFHAEATSEKCALGFHLDGRVTAVLGTHTHVQTNDIKLLPKGTLYLTDAGMCGSMDSVIGMESKSSIEKFLTGINKKFIVEMKGRMVLNGVIFQVDKDSKKVISSKLIRVDC